MTAVSAGVPRLRSHAQLQKQLHCVAAEVVLCGHSHLARFVEVDAGPYIFNPGSVGLPA